MGECGGRRPEVENGATPIPAVPPDWPVRKRVAVAWRDANRKLHV